MRTGPENLQHLLDAFPEWSVDDAGPFFMENVQRGIRNRSQLSGALTDCVGDFLLEQVLNIPKHF